MRGLTEGRVRAASARRWALPLALGLTAVIMTSCDGTTAGTPLTAVSGSPGHGTPGVIPATSCNLRRAALLGPDVPGFAAFVGFSQVSLPVRSVTAHPLWFQRDYVCGRYYGFVTTAALRGVYRRENNATARAARYPIRKWPYVPLTGEIVARLRHSVRDIRGRVPVPLGRRRPRILLVVRGGPATTPVTETAIPGSFVATSTVLRPDPADEHVIRVTGQIGAFEITASLQGGQGRPGPMSGPMVASLERLQHIRNFESQG